MDDSWEITNFGNLTTADKTSDYDGDGYTDLQEYLNSAAGENDPQGIPYNPREKNAPGGTGYIPGNSDKSFWTIMLPSILKAGNK